MFAHFIPQNPNNLNNLNNIINNLIENRFERNISISNVYLQRLLTTEFGGSDADGIWSWKQAYDILEVAQIKYIQQKLTKLNSEDTVKLLIKLEQLCPSHSKRNIQQIKLQQFSTPLKIGYLVSKAAQINQKDIVLEPSAGNGNLAVFAAHNCKHLILNEIDAKRNKNLQYLFPQADVYQLNGEQINDRLDVKHQPSVILINPPFTSYLNKETKSNDALYQHLLSALKRLQPNGRLVLISQETVRFNNPTWSRRFREIEKIAQITFTAGILGKEYAKMGTRINTRITIFDRIANQGKDLPKVLDLMSFEELLPLIKKISPRISSNLTTPNKNNRPKQMSRRRTRKCPPGQMSLFSFTENNAIALNVVYPNPNPVNFRSSKKKIVSKLSIPRETKKPKSTPPSKNVLQLFSKTNHWKEATKLQYTTVSTINKKDQEGLYQTYSLQDLQISGSREHPAQLVESEAMASIKPPKPTYQPLLPPNIIYEGILSEVQLEAVIRAGESHSKFLKRWISYDAINEKHEYHSYEAPDSIRVRQGFFCGDGTGVGKARIVAGTILDNWLQGTTKAVWISVNNRLFDDACKEWCALGGSKNDLFDLSKISQGAKIDRSTGILFTTYGTIRTAAKQKRVSRVEQIFNWLGKDFQGVVAFDEAHLMGGAKSIKGEMGETKASAQGLAGIKLQNLIPQAKIIYLSATGASKIENLAYAERLGLWGTTNNCFRDRDDFINKIGSSGLTALEIVSRHLKSTGVYLARSIGFAGIKYSILEHKLTPEQTAIYDKYCEAYKIIYNNLQDALEKTNGSRNSGVRRSHHAQFENSKQRFFNQILLSMKANSLIDSLEKDLAEGKAPVIQLISTNEAILNRKLENIPTKEWEDLNIDLTPREIVLDYLNNAFPLILYQEISEDGEKKWVKARDENGQEIISQDALALKNKLIREILLLEPLPTALDKLVFHFGDRLAEVTGRSKRLIKYEEKGETKIKVETRSVKDNLADTQNFMDGVKDLLCFSTAGGTGASYHASLDCKNQKQRVHYIFEPGYRADVCLQGFGRSNRSNQACPPEFVLTTTNVKGEMRFISTIAKRLSTLGAITKGQRQTGNSGVFKEEDNLESKYAREGLIKLYRDIAYGLLPSFPKEKFEAETHLFLTGKHGMLPNLPPINQLLNRSLALPVARQNELLDYLQARIRNSIEAAKQLGTYDVGVETVKGNVSIVEKEVLWTDPESGTESTANKIKRLKDNPLRTWQSVADYLLTNEGKYIYNNQSNRVGVLIDTYSETDKNGNYIKQFKILRPDSSQIIKETDYQKSFWQEIPQLECMRLWNLELKQLPKFLEEYFYIISGLILPLWDKLGNSNLKIWRLIDNNTGESILGRMIRPEEIQTVYHNFNKFKVLTPEEILDNCWAKAIPRIKNNLKIKISKVMYQKRIELIGWERKDVERLLSYGCFEENLNWNLRLFIPQEKEKALEVIQKILDS